MDREATGISVQFMPAANLHPTSETSTATLRQLTGAWPQLAVRILDERAV